MRDSNGFSDKYIDIGMSKRIKSNLSVIIGDLKTPCKAGETIDVSDIDSPRVELMFCNKQSLHILISALQQAEHFGTNTLVLVTIVMTSDVKGNCL